jgi:excinuclease ABC subunit C
LTLSRGTSRKDKVHIPKFIVPTRGKTLELIKLGEENAKQYLEAQSDKHLLEEARLLASLKELQRVLDIGELPARMECFDISNIQGTNAVGSMVVFDYAHPKKDQYRKFKIKKKQTPDDFAMMREMLERRFKRSAEGEERSAKRTAESSRVFPLSSLPPSPSIWPLPNLIIIDGGKGQLSTAVSVLKQYQLNIPIIGLAKRLEEIFIPRKAIPLMLPDNSAALFLLQRIRDEAHRFAITYHRKLRSKSAVSSVLDQISGIGPNKKKKLLEKFGSAAKIKAASLTDISAVVGASAAEKLKASL